MPDAMHITIYYVLPVTAAPKLRMGNSTGWQHPEAWLGSVTSVQGNSRSDEEAAWQIVAASFPFGCVAVRGHFAAAFCATCSVGTFKVRINIRRMSDFASDVELREGSGQRTGAKHCKASNHQTNMSFKTAEQFRNFEVVMFFFEVSLFSAPM